MTPGWFYEGGISSLMESNTSGLFKRLDLHHSAICWVTSSKWGLNMQSKQAFQSGFPQWSGLTVMPSGSSVIAEEASLSHTNQRNWAHKDHQLPVLMWTHTELCSFSELWASPAFFRFAVSDFNRVFIAEDGLKLKKNITKPVRNGRRLCPPSRLMRSLDDESGQCGSWSSAGRGSSRGAPSQWSAGSVNTF